MATRDEAMYREFMAEMVHLTVFQTLSEYPALRDHAKFKEFALQNAREMVMQIKTWCLSGRVPSREETEVVAWPGGVWQMFKQNYMPHWFVARFPVRMYRRTIIKQTHHYFVCPHLVTEPNKHHVRFMATGSDMARYFR